MSIWLVGAGPMAEFHAATLKDLGHSFTVVARTSERATALAERHGAAVLTGGVEAALAKGAVPEYAIIALPVGALARVADVLVSAGVRHVLVEKPGGLSSAELLPVAHNANRAGAEVFVAYNRRFFASTLEAQRRIADAGRVLSLFFEFTEDADRIAALSTPDIIKRHWVLANSSHVIDLAFHLCGEPAQWVPRTSDALDWHPSGSDFRGMGTTLAGAHFSYVADWRGPGRWGIEVVLPSERLILRPMERLQHVPRGRFDPQPVEIDDDLDQRFKPGIHRQMQAFLGGEGRRNLLRLDEHVRRVDAFMEPIAGYVSSRYA